MRLSKLILFGLLLIAGSAEAAVRRLATDCTLPGFTPSEAQPFDLDSCTLLDGDDITLLMTDIRSQWPSVFAVRAPSKTVSVVSDTITWPTSTKFYYLLEDQVASNKLTIQHVASPTDYYRLWLFSNFNTVKLGGPNLSLTFRGNHPGLANCDEQYPAHTASSICDVNQGLLDFRMTDGTTAALADIRANVKFAQAYGLYTNGSFTEGGASNKITQLNVAGLYYATSGVFFHQGVRNAWADPNSTTISDPYNRMLGWDGTTPGQTQGGLLMGCTNAAKRQVRTNSFAGYYTDSIIGGITIEYGGATFTPRFSRQVGAGVNDPFVVKIKDWYVTGPGTGFPAGVRVKKNIETHFFKGDPHDFPDTVGPHRFLKIVKLPSTYGDGPGTSPLTGCATNNNFFDGPSNFARTENSVVGRLNRDWHIEFSGDFTTNFVRADLLKFSFDAARSYRHTMRAGSGTTITDTITLNDTDTVTGPGTFTNLATADGAGETLGQSNTIKQTTVAGVVTVGASTGTTTISDVTFTGSPRAVVNIGSGSSVVASNLCVPAGSTIAGSGSLTYNGVPQSLPYTIPQCGVQPTVPNPPTGLTAN